MVCSVLAASDVVVVVVVVVSGDGDGDGGCDSCIDGVVVVVEVMVVLEITILPFQTLSLQLLASVWFQIRSSCWKKGISLSSL